jgi:hypothetical protein
MAHTVEQVSIWVLEALEAEWRREPDITKCRTEGIVLGEVMAAHDLESTDIDRALEFMVAPTRQYLRVVGRQDGRAILPSDAGLAMLARIQLQRIDEAKAKADDEKTEKYRRQDVRLRIYTLIIALLAVLVSYLGYKLWK